MAKSAIKSFKKCPKCGWDKIYIRRGISTVIMKKLKDIRFEKSMHNLILDCPSCGKKPAHERFKNMLGAKYTDSFQCCKLNSGATDIFTAIQSWNLNVVSELMKRKRKYFKVE